MSIKSTETLRTNMTVPPKAPITKLNKIVKFCAADSVLNQKEVRYVNAIIEGPYISQIAHKNSGKLSKP